MMQKLSRRKFVATTGGAFVVASLPVSVVSAATARSLSYPPGTTHVISETALFIDQLTLNNNTIIFDPSVASCEITCNALILIGDNTIDLSPQVPIPAKPAGPPVEPHQADYDRPATTGTDGTRGIDGQNATGLKFVTKGLDASAGGSLWIKTDGAPGGPGGDAGKGAKGYGPRCTRFSGKNGGNGATGGTGGAGGNGGDTAVVVFTVQTDPPMAIRPSAPKIGKVAPSARPANANAATSPGTIVIFGAPGDGGPGGKGGGGGDEGEGRSCRRPASGAKPGQHGGNGANGARGTPGQYRR